MSGSCVKSGMLSNDGKKLSKDEIEDVLNSIILDLSIQVIPLVQNNGVTLARKFGKIFQQFIHPKVFSPTLSHIAIHLTLMSNLTKDSIYHKLYNVILEYGQYYSDESEEIKNLNDSKKCRTNFNNFQYYYINKDGARITLIRDEDLNHYYKLFEPDTIITNCKGFFSSPCLVLMASNHYGISVEECINNMKNLSSISDYSLIECEIGINITLRELCDNFRGKNWEAKDYNVLTHNCQYFAAEILKILKARRTHDFDKIRSKEKVTLPNCIISTLWDNEKLSALNTLGRIPVFGLIFDTFAGIFVKRPYEDE